MTNLRRDQDSDFEYRVIIEGDDISSIIDKTIPYEYFVKGLTERWKKTPIEDNVYIIDGRRYTTELFPFDSITGHSSKIHDDELFTISVKEHANELGLEDDILELPTLWNTSVWRVDYDTFYISIILGHNENDLWMAIKAFSDEYSQDIADTLTWTFHFVIDSMDRLTDQYHGLHS